MLKKDLPITPQSILDLSSPEGIVKFFTNHLSYDTGITEKSTPEVEEALKEKLHTHEELRRKITSFQRIARNSDATGTLHVYLYVLTSITSKARQDIAHDLLKLHNDNYLFILTTSTFNELELVYLDPVIGTEQGKRVTQSHLWAAASDEPPALVTTPQLRHQRIDRRHPSRVALRLFSNLRYTEHDTWEQCKVISRAYDTAETSEEFFNNRSLFSDHYLNKRVPTEIPEWRRTEGDGREAQEMEEAYEKLRRLYAGAESVFAGEPLENIRQPLFEEVLTLLGWKPAYQTQKRTTDGSQPDYLFSPPNYDDTETHVVCKIYPWGRNLDNYLSLDEDDDAHLTDPTANENPAAAIVSLLIREQASWGILTNGKLWRLYSAKARSRATNYYEVDLQEIITIPRQNADEAMKAFRYFWLFFHIASFTAKERQDYETPPYICLLDYLMRESEHYARDLGDSLKDRVFEEIFPEFAEGFIRYAQGIGTLPSDLGQLTEEERAEKLQEFFEGTLTFFYRLLVLLYAESRALLPIHDERYHEKSLAKIKEEIAGIVVHPPQIGQRWNCYCAFFNLVYLVPLALHSCTK